MSVAVWNRTAGTIGGHWHRLSWFLRAQVVGWSLFAVLEVVNLRVLDHDLPIALLRTAFVVSCLGIVSTGMRRVYLRRRVQNNLSSRTIAYVAGLSLAGSAAVASLIVTISRGLDLSLLGRDGFDDFLLPFTHHLMALIGWNLCYFWVRTKIAEQAEQRRAIRAETEALRAKLDELRLQLDPHFLFNALNGVAEEIPDHPQAALTMLRDLTAYLRHSLDGIHQTVVAVGVETAGLSAYLRVQKARFGDRLKVELDLDPDAAAQRIASFLLQPLVENAVKHGRRDGGVEITIAVRMVGSALHIEIVNTGTLDTAPNPRRRGIGLENVRRRLALHYPNRHTFDLAEQGGDPRTVVATLRLYGEPCGS